MNFSHFFVETPLGKRSPRTDPASGGASAATIVSGAPERSRDCRVGTRGSKLIHLEPFLRMPKGFEEIVRELANGSKN